MNKQSIIPTLLALVSMAGQGQEIKRVTATPEDFMEHMAMYGYEVFTFSHSIRLHRDHHLAGFSY